MLYFYTDPVYCQAKTVKIDRDPKNKRNKYTSNKTCWLNSP